MPFVLQYEVRVCYMPVGGGPMTQPFAQQFTMRMQPGQTGVGETPVANPTGGWPVGPGPVGIVVPGGEAPTQANFRTALTGSSSAPSGGASGSMAGDLDAQIAAQLARIQGFATGGG